MLHRREVVKTLLEERSEDLVVVSALGSPTWDVAAAGDHPRNFGFIGAMGQALPFALGVALSQPQKRVLAITGDGELLMSLGVLATIANQSPTNLAVVVLDNEAYMETGGQPTATAGKTDLAAVAGACGFPVVASFADESDMANLTALATATAGPVLATVKVVKEQLPMAFPYSFDGVTSMNRFRDSVTES